MVAVEDPGSVKVYTVNGEPSGSSSSLPDWLTRKRAAKSKGKRAVRERIEGTIELIQHFEFPEASNRIKTTRDGHHAIATGTYKPQMRVYDLDQLTLKFERHSDAENVDFIILSDDWTKTLHLQADRCLEVHTQGGFHYRTRIPRFGRALAYHFPSCDAFVAASGPEVYRLNLEQGRFLNPLILQGDGSEEILGVDSIDVNPAHQLLAFGVEGNGTVEFWDPRSRSRVGLLQLPPSLLSDSPNIQALPGVGSVARRGLSVTAIASRSDGLSYAFGTSTGHTLLYDIRSPRPFAMKDQGYGLPVKNISWLEGGNQMAGDGMLFSADKKVVKIWDRNEPTKNFASITPANDINHVHHVPGSGLIMLANEGIRMTNFYIPQLGPAPRWCSFLENITEEMEDQTAQTVYEDYKFVERGELSKLGLDTLVGTAALKPYMHGYFVSLRLYDAARVIANPFAYAEHREKLLKEKLDKESESRIRSKKQANAPKVNKALAERIHREEERAKRREEKRKQRMAAAASAPAEGQEGEDQEQDEEMEEETTTTAEKPSLLNDPRFKDMFENPEFQVNEESREFALLNPSSAAQRQKGKTAVEDEEDESDKMSSDGLVRDGSDDDSDSDDSKHGGSSDDDSSDAGDLNQFDPRSRLATEMDKRAPQPVRREPTKTLRMTTAQAHTTSSDSRLTSKDASFGQRRRQASTSGPHFKSKRGSTDTPEGAMQLSWVPSASSSSSAKNFSQLTDPDDMLVPGGRGKQPKRDRGAGERFGAGLERGGYGGGEEKGVLSESERKGRTQRRHGIRSGSKNAFRKM